MFKRYIYLNKDHKKWPQHKWFVSIYQEQESRSLWTRRVQFGLLSLFSLSVTHSHNFLLEISQNNW